MQRFGRSLPSFALGQADSSTVGFASCAGPLALDVAQSEGGFHFGCFLCIALQQLLLLQSQCIDTLSSNVALTLEFSASPWVEHLTVDEKNELIQKIKPASTIVQRSARHGGARHRTAGCAIL